MTFFIWGSGSLTIGWKITVFVKKPTHKKYSKNVNIREIPYKICQKHAKKLKKRAPKTQKKGHFGGLKPRKTWKNSVFSCFWRIFLALTSREKMFLAKNAIFSLFWKKTTFFPLFLHFLMLKSLARVHSFGFYPFFDPLQKCPKNDQKMSKKWSKNGPKTGFF